MNSRVFAPIFGLLCAACGDDGVNLPANCQSGDITGTIEILAARDVTACGEVALKSIAQGTTLRLRPGTVVDMFEGQSFAIDTVSRLIAEGTEERPITFQAATKRGWSTLSFPTSVNAEPSILKHVIFRGGRGDDPILAVHDGVRLNHVQIEDTDTGLSVAGWDPQSSNIQITTRETPLILRTEEALYDLHTVDGLRVPSNANIRVEGESFGEVVLRSVGSAYEFENAEFDSLDVGPHSFVFVRNGLRATNVRVEGPVNFYSEHDLAFQGGEIDDLKIDGAGRVEFLDISLTKVTVRDAEHVRLDGGSTARGLELTRTIDSSWSLASFAPGVAVTDSVFEDLKTPVVLEFDGALNFVGNDVTGSDTCIQTSGDDTTDYAAANSLNCPTPLR